jgi:folate-binding Fe-S cluster repair protein YgfZ
MDQLHGVAFDKGCYVGQEVVSRMQHRGTARTRIVSVTYAGPKPDDGVEITADNKALGTFGSGSGGFGVALVRLDRLGEAIDSGSAILAGGNVVAITKPAWATYPWPGEA